MMAATFLMSHLCYYCELISYQSHVRAV